MLTRNSAVLVALVVGTGHFLVEIWLHDLGGTAPDVKASATIVALTLGGLAALAWLHLPLLRPLLTIVGAVLLTGAWNGLAEAGTAAAGAGAIAYLTAANVLLAAGVVEFAAALGIRLLPLHVRA